MFDFGFWELVVVLVVALLVVGPERLPQVARTAGLWIGRLRCMTEGMREEIRRELEAEELKKGLRDLKDESGIDELEREMRATDGEVRDGLESAQRAVNPPQRYEILERDSAEDGGPAGAATGDPQGPSRPRARAEAAPPPADAAPEPAPRPAPAHPAAHRDGTHAGKARGRRGEGRRGTAVRLPPDRVAQPAVARHRRGGRHLHGSVGLCRRWQL